MLSIHNNGSDVMYIAVINEKKKKKRVPHLSIKKHIAPYHLQRPFVLSGKRVAKLNLVNTFRTRVKINVPNI